MAYSDILNATSLYGNLLKNQYANAANNIDMSKMDYVPVNPYSSGAFTPQSARNIYQGTGRGLITDIQATEENQLTGFDNILSKGAQGLQYYQIANKVSPYVQKLGSNIAGTLSKSFTSNPAAASFNLGPAALTYGLTRDNNPYEVSKMESYGTTAATAMAAHQLSKLLPATSSLAAGGANAILGVNPVVLIGSLLLGSFFNKKAKKKASKLKQKEIDRVEGIQADVAEDREERVEEMREEMLSQQQARDFEKRSSQYANQYGGNYRDYMEKGGKMDIVAEFTGNELIVNDQDALEFDIAKGRTKSAANRIRKAMNGGKITPGDETHKGNPISVSSDGTMHTKKGPMSFKVKKGAGIYDHATDQFKSDMDDNTIVKVVKKNMKKWKKNNMA
tara:strand:+ start:4389 stop:5561 length:1173 start_codon:yes stop_codon:yes gene_type:complete